MIPRAIVLLFVGLIGLPAGESSAGPPADIPMKPPVVAPVVNGNAGPIAAGPLIVAIPTDLPFIAGAPAILQIALPKGYVADRDYPMFLCIDIRGGYPPEPMFKPPVGSGFVLVTIPCPSPYVGPEKLRMFAQAVLEVIDREVPNTSTHLSTMYGVGIGADVLTAIAGAHAGFAERFAGVMLSDGGAGSPGWMRGRRLFITGSEGTETPSKVKLFATAAQTAGVDVTWVARVAQPPAAQADSTVPVAKPDKNVVVNPAVTWISEGLISGRSDAIAAAQKHAGAGRWQKALQAARFLRCSVVAGSAEATRLESVQAQIETACTQAATRLGTKAPAADLRDFIATWRGCAATVSYNSDAEAKGNAEVEGAIGFADKVQRTNLLLRLVGEWHGYEAGKRAVSALDDIVKSELAIALTKVGEVQLKQLRRLSDIYAMTPSGVQARTVMDTNANVELTSILALLDEKLKEARLIAFIRRNDWLPCANKAIVAAAKFREARAAELHKQAITHSDTKRRQMLKSVCEQFPGTAADVKARAELDRPKENSTRH